MMTRMQIVTNKAGASAAVAARRTTTSSLSLKRSSVSKSLSVSKNVTKRTLKVNASNDELKNKAQDLLTTAQVRSFPNVTFTHSLSLSLTFHHMNESKTIASHRRLSTISSLSPIVRAPLRLTRLFLPLFHFICF